MMGDIFDENEGRRDLADDAGDLQPEVMRVVGTPALERVWRKPEADRKSRAACAPMDAVLMFKTLVLTICSKSFFAVRRSRRRSCRSCLKSSRRRTSNSALSW